MRAAQARGERRSLTAWRWWKVIPVDIQKSPTNAHSVEVTDQSSRLLLKQTEKLHMQTIIRELTSGSHNTQTYESNYMWKGVKCLTVLANTKRLFHPIVWFLTGGHQAISPETGPTYFRNHWLQHLIINTFPSHTGRCVDDSIWIINWTDE